MTLAQRSVRPEGRTKLAEKIRVLSLTLRRKTRLTVAAPSVTETVIFAAPVNPRAGETLIVQLDVPPPKMIWLGGTRTGLDEVAETVRIPAGISGSLIVKGMSGVALNFVIV